MKTLLATTIAAVLATTGTAVFAGNIVPAPADPVLPAATPMQIADWTGFYFGGTGGWATGERVGVDDFEGVLYGGFAGYNYQFGNGFVLGGEIAGSMGEPDWDAGGTFEPTYIDLKGRAGYAIDRALVYVSGGYTFASFANNDEGGGFNLGAGVDYLITDNIFVGAEYIYRDIEDTVADPAAWQDQFSTIQARVGVSF